MESYSFPVIKNEPDAASTYIIRPSWHHTFLEICQVVGKRSTCQRLQTAALIVRDQNIISMGYNGVSRGQQHCSMFWRHFFLFIKNFYTHSLDQPELKIQLTEFYKDIVANCDFNITLIEKFETFEEFSKSGIFSKLHHYWSVTNELHGEVNALLQCESSKIGATLYTLYGPCIQCAKSIVSAQIKEVYYHEEYTRDMTGVDFLKKNGIHVEKI